MGLGKYVVYLASSPIKREGLRDQERLSEEEAAPSPRGTLAALAAFSAFPLQKAPHRAQERATRDAGLFFQKSIGPRGWCFLEKLAWAKGVLEFPTLAQ